MHIVPTMELALSEKLQEQFSLAFVHAIATVAGFTMTRVGVDRQSVDLTVESGQTGTPYEHPRIELQLKSTSLDNGYGEHLSYPLPIKNYNDLRKKTLVPRLLVIISVKSNIPREWLSEEPETLILRGKGLYYSLSGLPESTNKTTVSIRVPRTQRFTVESLKNLMGIVAHGERP